jgi:GH24 family phage-related lysozyme (muramidase)
MGNSRIPGPLGWNDTFLDIDDGTLMRCAMPVPGPVGIAATPTVVGTSTAAKAAPTELTWSQIKEDIREHEGVVLHMYLDSVNKVTVGVGNLLPNLEAAQALPFVQRKSPATKASADEIKTDWDSVKLHPNKNLSATAFAEYTTLILPEDFCWSLMKKRVDNEFLPALKRKYTDWNSFPIPAKRALLDMIYNLGSRGLSNYKVMNSHVAKLEWDKVANNCNRPDLKAHRNNWTRERFKESMPTKGTP